LDDETDATTAPYEEYSAEPPTRSKPRTDEDIAPDFDDEPRRSPRASTETNDFEDYDDRSTAKDDFYNYDNYDDEFEEDNSSQFDR